MDMPVLINAIVHVYLLGMMFFGMIFTIQDLAARVPPQNRLFLILGLFILNVLTAGMVFLIIGIWGVAYKTTEIQERKKKDE